MIDEIEGLRIIVSGSSLFDITKNTGEPLTGRKYTFNLYAFSESEYNQIEENISKIDKIKERLNYFYQGQRLWFEMLTTICFSVNFCFF